LPEDRLVVIRALGEGVPFVSSNPKSPLSQSIVELAMWLMYDLKTQARGSESHETASPNRRWRLSRKKAEK